MPMSKATISSPVLLASMKKLIGGIRKAIYIGPTFIAIENWGPYQRCSITNLAIIAIICLSKHISFHVPSSFLIIPHSQPVPPLSPAD